MSKEIPAERLSAAVPLAVAIITAIDTAAVDNRTALDLAVTVALEDDHDTEAVLLALANMAHALLATLARQTGASTDTLLASISQVSAEPDRS